MRKINKRKKYHALIRKFLKGQMTKDQENDFFKKLDTEPMLHKMAVTEAVLYKSIEMQQDKSRKIIEEIKKTDSNSLPFLVNRDKETDSNK